MGKITLTDIFITFFKIALFTLGGGLVMVPVMRREFVEKRGLMTDDAFYDIAGIVQAMPGIVAVNSAIMIGRHIRGFPGAVSAVLGVMTPSVVIIFLVAELISAVSDKIFVMDLFSAIRSGGCAILAIILFDMAGRTVRGYRELLLIVSGVILVNVLDMDVLVCVLVSGVLGVVFLREE